MHKGSSGRNSAFHSTDRTVGFPSSHLARIAQFLRLDRVVRGLLPYSPSTSSSSSSSSSSRRSPFPSLPLLRRPSRLLSAHLIIFDLLRLRLLFSPNRRRVLLYQRINCSFIPVCSAGPSFSPVWIPGTGFSLKYLGV